MVDLLLRWLFVSTRTQQKMDLLTDSLWSIVPTPGHTFADSPESTSKNTWRLDITRGSDETSTDDSCLSYSSAKDSAFSPSKVAKASTVGLSGITSNARLTASSSRTVGTWFSSRRCGRSLLLCSS
jgi:hypothetical protein